MFKAKEEDLMEETLKMSNKEVDRHAVLVQVQQKKLKQAEAAKILNISDRHVRNLLLEVTTKGPSGLISKKRGAGGFVPQGWNSNVVGPRCREKYQRHTGPTTTSREICWEYAPNPRISR